MFPTLATSLSFFFVSLLLPSPTTSQTLWDYPVDFRSSNVWPSETCVRSCLTGDQCIPCGGYSLSTWVGCTTNSCFCNRYDVAYYYLVNCITANCCPTCVSSNPYQLIYGYCQPTAEKVNGGGGAAVTTKFTAPPSVTPTVKPVSNPYAAEASEASDKPPTATTTATPQPPAVDTGLTRSDKIALGVGLGVGIPSAIAAFIVIFQFCRDG